MCIRDRAYAELQKVTPRQGSVVDTPEGRGKVISTQMLRGTCKVQLDDSPEHSLTEFQCTQCCMVTVSYTHLDVYKRQIVQHGGTLFSTLLHSLYAAHVFNPLGNQTEYIDAVRGRRVVHGILAVSYTHLDVYKRQLHTQCNRISAVRRDRACVLDRRQRLCGFGITHGRSCLLYTSICFYRQQNS